MATKLLFHFDEPAGVHPSDAAGNLDDLYAATGKSEPAPVSAWTGIGRQFVRDSGALGTVLLAADLAERDTLIQRDLTIQVLMTVTLSAGPDEHTVIVRGLRDGSLAERVAFGLQLKEQSGNPGYVEVQLMHEDSGGVLRFLPPGVFQHPGDGKEFLLTATRRWERTDKVVVRYYVNDEPIAELESTHGDIAGGTTGHTVLGARPFLGTWDKYFEGVLDEMLVLDVELSLEEVRHTWRRLTDYQPGGVETLIGLCPPGLDWGANPGNNEGRRLKVLGQGLGQAVASTEELRELWLPDRMPVELAPRWERICGLTPKPRDSLDTRRTRVVSFLAREEGLDLPAMRTAFEEVLDADADDLAILENTNEIRDEFTDATLHRRWFDNGLGSAAVAAGELVLTMANGGDYRYEVVGTRGSLRTSLDTGGEDFHVRGKIASYANLATSSFCGLVLENRVARHVLWFGVYNNAGTKQIGWRVAVDGVPGAWTSLAAAPALAPVWLRVSPPAAASSGSYSLAYSTTGEHAGFTATEVATGVVDVEWAGFGLYKTTAAAVNPDAATFDDFASFCPGGTVPFWWFVFRDPLLLGAPDLPGANALVAKVKPAHTAAAACESTSVLCGDPRYGLCGRAPV